MLTKDTLKQWFSNGKKPDQSQFWAWMDAYYYKGEPIPITVIEGMNEILVNKADKQVTDTLFVELAKKADKQIVEALQTYVYGLIEDSLSQASDKTYSIDKIQEITKGFLREAVTDIDYDPKTQVLIIEYEKDSPKKISLKKADAVNIINDDLEEGKENTYSIDKILSLISKGGTQLKSVENPTETPLTYDELENLYPNFSKGDVVLCENANEKYEKTSKGWVKYNVYPVNKTEFKLLLNYSSISDANLDEINRANRIVVTEQDLENFRFKCNLKDYAPLKTLGTKGESWLISQGSEASSYCDLNKIDPEGWIYYGKTYLGAMNFSMGSSIEFFNPFVNYEILNNQRPTLATSTQNSTVNSFENYPTTLNEKKVNHLKNGGILQKSDGNFRTFLIEEKNGETFLAEDSDITNSFSLLSNKPFFPDNIKYPTARKKGDRLLMWGTVNVSKQGILVKETTQLVSYVGLLRVTDGNIADFNKGHFPGFVFLDTEGELINNQIYEFLAIRNLMTKYSTWEGGWQITGLAFYQNKWHFMAKCWKSTSQKMQREIWHITAKEGIDLFDLCTDLDLDSFESVYLIHRGIDYKATPNSIFYGQSDFNLFTYKDKMYSFFFTEPLASGFLNTNNRMLGLAQWNTELKKFDFNKGLQLINPVQLFRKQSNLYWCFDHWGSLIHPLILGDNFYVSTDLATDNPDYFPTILKLNLDGFTQ